jgi:pyridoxamine 5'-phosphate oxidase
MNKELLENLRQEYKSNSLEESNALTNPFEMFEKWFGEAMAADLHEPNAMSLATVNHLGEPSVRIVLLKGFSESGFVFYSNYQSKKGEELIYNPKAALLFYWGELERQIRIQGVVQKLSEVDSTAYFNSRPIKSQMGAIISPQSQIIPNRKFLEERWSALEKVVEDRVIGDQEIGKQELIKPKHWGGYCLKASSFEFWQGRRSRLHDRILYQVEENVWKKVRLAP